MDYSQLMQNEPALQLWGHRGMGATDSAFVRSLGNHLTRPPEQSLKSLMMAFDHGATAFEADVIRTQDDHLVLMHSTRYGEHVASSLHIGGKPYLDQLTLAEIQAQLHLGFDGDPSEPIPEFTEVLRALMDKFPDLATAGIVRFNIELKDVQGTDCPRRQPPLCALVLRDIEAVGFPLAAARFSSFSLDCLADMAKRAPKAKLALLTDVGPEHGGGTGKRIFGAEGDSTEVYRGFFKDAIDEAQARLGSALVAIHPEIRTVTDAIVAHVAECRLALATWGWREVSPLAQMLEGQVFAGAAKRCVQICERHNVKLALITDHLDDLAKYLAG